MLFVGFWRVLLIGIVFINEALATSIYIYAGDGACLECIEQTEESLSQISPQYHIFRITALEVIKGSWRDDAALFIIPGGRATPYAQSLNGLGNAQIRQYVENGGAFLGICAGGYYAGALVEFAKGTPIEVIAARELAFFPGKVIGPAFPHFDYYSESGARLATINWLDSEQKSIQSTLYYNGGGYFATVSKEAQVLATYDELAENRAAIVLVKVKKGKVLLSGVHFEYHSDMLLRISKAINTNLLEANRLRLLKKLLSHLGIS